MSLYAIADSKCSQLGLGPAPEDCLAQLCEELVWSVNAMDTKLHKEIKVGSVFKLFWSISDARCRIKCVVMKMNYMLGGAWWVYYSWAPGYGYGAVGYGMGSVEHGPKIYNQLTGSTKARDCKCEWAALGWFCSKNQNFNIHKNQIDFE